MIINTESNSNWVLFNNANLSITNGVFQAMGAGIKTAYSQTFPLSKVAGGLETMVEFSCEARLVSGSYGYIGIERASTHDMSTATIVVIDSVKIDTPDWTLYTLRGIFPINITDPLGLITVGVAGSQTATIQFRNPKLKMIDGISQNQPELIATALIQKASGGSPAINVDFPNFGISNVTFNGTDTITVTLKSATTLRKRASVMVSGTPDNPLIPLAGTVVAANNTTFVVKYTNGTSIQNIASSTIYFVIWVYI